LTAAARGQASRSFVIHGGRGVAVNTAAWLHEMHHTLRRLRRCYRFVMPDERRVAAAWNRRGRSQPPGAPGRWRHVAALAVLLASACASPADDSDGRMAERVGLTMGSRLRVSALTHDPAAAESAFAAVFAEFDRLDRLLSVWKEDSDVLRVNAAAGVHAVAVGPDMLEVLHSARQISEWSRGKFDVTFGALADVWKFDHDQDNTVPTREQIQARLPLVDYSAVDVDQAAGTVFLKRSGMRIHLGGIGKGYAVAHAVKILRDRGFHHFMIQAGGDLYVGGRRRGKPWRLGIADPRNAEQTFGALDLSDGTFSTSGDYERFFIKDGRRYHHIIDPDIGEPARGCRSVTIVSDSPILADGLSKSVFILGPVEGMALVERLPQVEAVIVTAANEVLVSSGLRGRFVQRQPPTDGP
jgi:thiamine biosynthesis lipoprotein